MEFIGVAECTASAQASGVLLLLLSADFAVITDGVLACTLYVCYEDMTCSRIQTLHH